MKKCTCGHLFFNHPQDKCGATLTRDKENRVLKVGVPCSCTKYRA
jgi:hypothetical protein